MPKKLRQVLKAIIVADEAAEKAGRWCKNAVTHEGKDSSPQTPPAAAAGEEDGKDAPKNSFNTASVKSKVAEVATDPMLRIKVMSTVASAQEKVSSLLKI